MPSGCWASVYFPPADVRDWPAFNRWPSDTTDTPWVFVPQTAVPFGAWTTALPSLFTTTDAPADDDVADDHNGLPRPLYTTRLPSVPRCVYEPGFPDVCEVHSTRWAGSITTRFPSGCCCNRYRPSADRRSCLDSRP